jgi:hypothetical protein
MVISQPRSKSNPQLHDGTHGKLTENRQQDHAKAIEDDDERGREGQAEQEGEEEVTLVHFYEFIFAADAFVFVCIVGLITAALIEFR